MNRVSQSQAVRWFASAWVTFWVLLVLHISCIVFIKHYKQAATWENGAMAESLFEGRGMRWGFSLGDDEFTSWQAPGYPYVLASGWHWFGKGERAYLVISLFQALALSSMVFPMGWLASRWFDEEVAGLCRWIVCLMPLYAWYATRIHHTAFVMACHPWLLYGWLSLTDRPQWRRALGTGLGTGLAGLFQPVLLGVLGAISFVLLLGAILRKHWSMAGKILFGGVLTLLVLTPWTIRNYQVHGRLLLIKDSFGKEFWMGNNPNATGTGYIEGGHAEVTFAYPPKALELRGKVPEIVLMDAMQKEAWDYCKAEPGAFLKRTVTKITWFWTMTPLRYERSTGDGEAHKYRLLQGGYWFLFLALIGVSIVGYRPWRKEYIILLVFFSVFYSLIYGLTHVGQARFRGEIEYLFIPAAAAGCIMLWRYWKGCRSTRPSS